LLTFIINILIQQNFTEYSKRLLIENLISRIVCIYIFLRFTVTVV